MININRLRIKITNKCNFNCFFCHNEGSFESNDLLTSQDFDFIADTCTKLGIKRFKITGGEPLLRNDVVDIISTLRKYTDDDISMSTNGYYLDIYARKLKKVGLDRIDISIHSLNRKVYKEITGINALDKVLSNLKLVVELGFKQIKINILAMTINVHEIPSFIKLAQKLSVDLQIIELMPIGRGKEIFSKYHVDVYEILNKLKDKASRIYYRGDLHNRPILEVNGIKIEFVKGFCNPDFCKNCKQIRLTSDGKLKGCIYRNIEIDVLNIIKNRNEIEFVRSIERLLSMRKPMFI